MAIVATLLSYSINAQEQIGLNPPSMKWSQITTPSGRVIFPRGLDTLAFRAASLMQYQRQQDATIAGDHTTKRVPVILQNQSTLPAGFSTPAPWRNEYYLTPPQNIFLGPVRWEIAMPVHEYRHAQQFSMGSKGFTWIYRVLMGQTGWLFNSLMTQPLWFREGDAVVAETLFTNGGRGRLPSFHMEYRAMRMAGYHYDYEKAHYLSFRDFVPNPYRIGYYMVTKARREFGDDIWTKTLYDAYHRKGFLFPFSRSFRKHTGMTTKQFYGKTVKELDSLWKETDAVIDSNGSKRIADPDTRKYTSYRYPHYLGDGSVLVVKSGLDLINTFYRIKDGKEQKLFHPGLYTDDHMTSVIEGDLLTWAESGFHERWINRDYSVIKTYNFKTGEVKKLSSRSRYFSPAPSPDGTKIIVSETDTNIHYALVILDAESGRELKRLPNPSNLFFTHMRWIDDQFVIAIALNDSGNAIVKVDTDTGGIETLLPESHIPFSRPYAHDNHVYFSAGAEGINNIYALDISSGETHKITNVRFGAFEPVVSRDGKTLLYSEYTADGYRIQEMPIDPTVWIPAELRGSGDILFHAPLAGSEGTDVSKLPLQTYRVKKYHALSSGLFNPYGWIPLPNIPEYGLELYTRNLMSTLAGTLGYAYNTNENRSRYYARLTYAALYPHIELNVSNGARRSATILPDPTAEEYIEPEWRETTISAGLRLPFRLTQGTHQTELSIGGFYEYYDIATLDSADLSVETDFREFDAIKGELVFSRLQTQARQHVKPRWGQTLNITATKALDETPRRLVANTLLYFPGLFRTHSFNFRLAYREEEVVDTYRYLDDFIMPRGYESMPFEKLSLASVNYELPLWYPDLSAGSVAFLQRLRTNVFFDYAEGRVRNFNQSLTSAGAELFIDLRLFRLFQTTIAFRFNSTFDKPIGETIPFQFLITRFELAN